MNASLFIIGLAIGFVVSGLGGLIEYLLHLRRDREPRFGVPGCLVYVIGGLILAGIAAIIASLITTGTIIPALIMGAGVLTGFYGGFIGLVGVWLVLENRQSKTAGIDNEISTEQTRP